MSKLTALIDGDIIVYSVGFAAENDPVQNALHSAKIMINRILEKTGADSYVTYLTGRGNYRDDIATIAPYKGNRTGNKPIHYNAIREYLMDYHNGELIIGKEADDAMGIAQTGNESTTVICSLDKDMDMIKGVHYNWRKDKVYAVDQGEADIWFMEQLMTGDTCDNIKGLRGIGPKKAQKVIRDAEDMTDLYWTILEMYEMQYDKPFEAMMENANLLWIQRYEDKLWNPLAAEFANIED